ncbi:succinate--CoA ligase subunit alpha [Pseudomonas sp. NY15181]|uniref:succinate--CoA ligase subunit alpha n=1 Tax=Pseudomonas sp. NY15181 TaxID=3400349 RepID=UPI003A8B3B20
MSVVLSATSKVIFYGTNSLSSVRMLSAMIEAGTFVSAVITNDPSLAIAPSKPFPTAKDAAIYTGKPDVALIFTNPADALAAVEDALSADASTIITITEYVPVHDALLMKDLAREKGALLIGPNSSGVLSAGIAQAGYICNDICNSGNIGVIAKSGSVAYAAMSEMKGVGLGISTVISIGGDMVKGSDFREALALFEADDDTDAILLLGEIGGADEELAAEFISAQVRKPVVAFISGKSVKPGQSVGHAGAIVTKSRGGYEGKVKAFRDAGVIVAENFSQITEKLLLLSYGQ